MLMENLYSFLSYLLLAIIIVDFLIRLLRKEGRYTKYYFTYLFLTLGIVLTLKIIFRVYRSNEIDPFAFPSGHASLAIVPFFIYERPYFKVLWLIYALFIGYLRILAGVHDLIQVLFGYIFTSIGILAFNYLEKDLGKELHRKVIHLGLGSIIGYVTFIRPIYGIYLMFLLLIVGAFLYLIRRTYFVSFFLREYSKDESGREAFTFVIGILVSYIIGLFLGINPYFIAFYLAWVDGLAAIFGLRFKAKEKSVNGLLGGILGGVISVLATRTNPLFVIVIPLIEYKVKRFDDNLIIPIFTLLLYILLAQVSSMGLYYLSPQFPF
ncbi:hypothetical protein BA065_02455 [Nanoarchaeota archaeon NZ13-N]|nr:MAG: hypothetical protein BA065_02455 [Nanoarchaeota archaeon NZ13-N]